MVVIVHVKKRIAPHWALRVACFDIIVDSWENHRFAIVAMVGAVLIVDGVDEYF